MGYYSGSFTLDFEGRTCEKQMMEKLLRVMDRDYDKYNMEWTLPLDEVFDFCTATALFGPLEKGDDGTYYFSYPELMKAPTMFAVLFPSSGFHYSIEVEYSVTCEDTWVLTANYESGILMMKEVYGDEEERDDNYKNIILSKTELFRDTEYENTFFEGKDLQAYLVEEQIKNKDMTLVEYIKQFPFTEEQFQSFIQTAADCDFTEMTAFLLEEKQSRVAADKKGCDGTSILRRE